MKKILIIITMLFLVACATQAEKTASAAKEASEAKAFCAQKYPDGTAKTHLESVQCSNPLIIVAFQKAGFPYMDIIELGNAKRLDIAERLDKGVITINQADLEMKEYGLKLNGITQQRDHENFERAREIMQTFQGSVSSPQSTTQHCFTQYGASNSTSTCY